MTYEEVYAERVQKALRIDREANKLIEEFHEIEKEAREYGITLDVSGNPANYGERLRCRVSLSVIGERE